MKIRALITSGLISRTITAKSGKNVGKDFTFRTLNCLDLDAQKQEVIQLEVHENDAAEAHKLQGKTIVVNADYSNGKFFFLGQHQQAAA